MGIIEEMEKRAEAVPMDGERFTTRPGWTAIPDEDFARLLGIAKAVERVGAEEIAGLPVGGGWVEAMNRRARIAVALAANDLPALDAALAGAP